MRMSLGKKIPYVFFALCFFALCFFALYFFCLMFFRDEMAQNPNISVSDAMDYTVLTSLNMTIGSKVATTQLYQSNTGLGGTQPPALLEGLNFQQSNIQSAQNFYSNTNPNIMDSRRISQASSRGTANQEARYFSNSQTDLNHSLGMQRKASNPLKRVINFNKKDTTSTAKMPPKQPTLNQNPKLKEEIEFTKKLLFARDENMLDVGGMPSSRRNRSHRALNQSGNSSMERRGKSNVKISYKTSTFESEGQRQKSTTVMTQRQPVRISERSNSQFRPMEYANSSVVRRVVVDSSINENPLFVNERKHKAKIATRIDSVGSAKKRRIVEEPKGKPSAPQEDTFLSSLSSQKYNSNMVFSKPLRPNENSASKFESNNSRRPIFEDNNSQLQQQRAGFGNRVKQPNSRRISHGPNMAESGEFFGAKFVGGNRSLSKKRQNDLIESHAPQKIQPKLSLRRNEANSQLNKIGSAVYDNEDEDIDSEFNPLFQHAKRDTIKKSLENSEGKGPGESFMNRESVNPWEASQPPKDQNFPIGNLINPLHAQMPTFQPIQLKSPAKSKNEENLIINKLKTENKEFRDNLERVRTMYNEKLKTMEKKNTELYDQKAKIEEKLREKQKEFLNQINLLNSKISNDGDSEIQIKEKEREIRMLKDELKQAIESIKDSAEIVSKLQSENRALESKNFELVQDKSKVTEVEELKRGYLDMERKKVRQNL